MGTTLFAGHAALKPTDAFGRRVYTTRLARKRRPSFTAKSVHAQFRYRDARIPDVTCAIKKRELHAAARFRKRAKIQGEIRQAAKHVSLALPWHGKRLKCRQSFSTHAFFALSPIPHLVFNPLRPRAAGDNDRQFGVNKAGPHFKCIGFSATSDRRSPSRRDSDSGASGGAIK